MSTNQVALRSTFVVLSTASAARSAAAAASTHDSAGRSVEDLADLLGDLVGVDAGQAGTNEAVALYGVGGGGQHHAGAGDRDRGEKDDADGGGEPFQPRPGRSPVSVFGQGRVARGHERVLAGCGVRRAACAGRSEGAAAGVGDEWLAGAGELQLVSRGRAGELGVPGQGVPPGDVAGSGQRRCAPGGSKTVGPGSAVDQKGWHEVPESGTSAGISWPSADSPLQFFDSPSPSSVCGPGLLHARFRPARTFVRGGESHRIPSPDLGFLFAFFSAPG
ncbi:hypothetical protein SMICM17S_01014 [Streptomyces microflavus]